MSFTNRLLDLIDRRFTAPVISAHCDGPCGVYDPASARIPAEAVLSLTKKLLDLDLEAPGTLNTYTRFVAIKEEQAQLVKDELSVLLNDYFKPEHLEQHPDLHEIFWKAVKLASTTKHEVNLDAANELLAQVETIHHLFWSTKGREVAWVLANP